MIQILTRFQFGSPNTLPTPLPLVMMRPSSMLYFSTNTFLTASARFSDSFWLNSALPFQEKHNQR